MAKKKSLDELIDEAKLKLAFLKENRFYRRMYKPVVVEGCPVIVTVTDPIDQKNKEITYEKNPNLILAYSILHFVTLLRPPEIPVAYTSGFDTCDYALMNLPSLSENELSTLFDPKKDVNHMSQKMTDVLLDLFKPTYVKGIVQRSCSELPKVNGIISMDGIAIWFPQDMNMIMYPGPRRRANIATIAWYQVDTFCEGLPNVCFDELRQQPWERRVSVNVSGPKSQIMNEFARFVDHEQKRSKEHVSLISQTDAHAIAYRNYTKWRQDNSRSCKELWKHLKVWKLIWNQGKNLKEIARELNLPYDEVKYSYRRAYQLIYDRSYDYEDARKNKREIEKPDPERFNQTVKSNINNCPHRPCLTCDLDPKPCLKFAAKYIYQDSVPQRKLPKPEDRTKQDDGIWCPECQKEGKYSWLDFKIKTVRDKASFEIYEPCPVHKKCVILKNGQLLNP